MELLVWLSIVDYFESCDVLPTACSSCDGAPNASQKKGGSAQHDPNIPKFSGQLKASVRWGLLQVGRRQPERKSRWWCQRTLAVAQLSSCWRRFDGAASWTAPTKLCCCSCARLGPKKSTKCGWGRCPPRRCARCGTSRISSGCSSACRRSERARRFSCRALARASRT